MPKGTNEDEQKTERFNMFMSPGEMKAIEEWAWNNRIRSKSEAVRRLCQIGLGVEQDLDEASDLAADVLKKSEDELNRLRILIRDQVALGSAADENISEAFTALYDVFERAEKLHVSLVAAFNRIVPLIDDKSLDVAIVKSRDALSTVQAVIDRINRRDEEREENKIISQWSMTASDEEKAAYEALSEDEKDSWWDRRVKDLLPPEKPTGRFKR